MLHVERILPTVYVKMLHIIFLHISIHKSVRGKSPNMGKCTISYQEVLHSLLKNVNHQEHEAFLCNHSINGQMLRTSVLTGCLCFGAL